MATVSGVYFSEAVAARLAALPRAAQPLVLDLLDQVSRPLGPRQIEQALRTAGISKTQRAALAGALKGLDIIAITSPANRKDDGHAQQF